MLYLVRKNRLIHTLGVKTLCITKIENLVQMQEYYKNLVLERRKDIIINFLFEQNFIPENTIVASKEKVLYQRIQSKKWSNSIYKRRTPEEFL